MKHLKRIPLWRLIALAAVAAVFALFFYPLATGYLDLCNLSVMLGCGLLAVVLIRWESFVRLLRRLWGKTWGKVLLLTAFGALAAVLFGIIRLGAHCLTALADFARQGPELVQRMATGVGRLEAGLLAYIEAAPPEGSSYARDIAEKYGVTYESLTAAQPE